MKYTKLKYENALRNEILNYSVRQKELWHRSYHSLDSYQYSIQNNRKKWNKIIGGIDSLDQNINLKIISLGKHLKKIAITTPLGFQSDSLLSLPKNTGTSKSPLVLCLHGIGGSPEMVLGESETNPASYHGYGQSLVDAGFAVLTLKLVNNFKDRARINRMALLLGSSIWGIEIQVIKNILEFVIKEFEIEKTKIAAWGLSMGGAYLSYLMPVEEQIKVGIISAWFNNRTKKMVVEDDRYTCFLHTEEEHVFLPGLLTGFSDQDLVSLILPRPLLIQTGEKDDVAWPKFVKQEFQAANFHYKQLGIEDRLLWQLHSGGHEVDVQAGVDFLKKWL